MKYLFILLTVATTPLIAQNKNALSFDDPPGNVSVFGKGFISTFINERDFAISPDGAEIFFTISTPRSSFQTIVTCRKRRDDTWSDPEVVPFAGTFSDLEPAFSADGNTLYFASNRPVEGEQPKDFDIFKVMRAGAGWKRPERLGNSINTTADEFYPSVAKNGNLYFTAVYKEGIGKEDIYVSKWKNNNYEKAAVLDSAVNSMLYEFNAFVASDESYLIYTSYGRKDDMGGGDLYISFADQNGHWKPAQNLKGLNSSGLDYCPYVSPDGKALFFTSDRHLLPVSFVQPATYKSVVDSWMVTSNGQGNIYWTDFNLAVKDIMR